MQSKANKEKEHEEQRLGQLIYDALNSCTDYIPKLKNAVVIIAEHIQKENKEGALELLPKATEGISWLVGAIAALKKHGLLESINIEEINEHLKELESALKNRDFVLTADLLEYEIAPMLDSWLYAIRQEAKLKKEI